MSAAPRVAVVILTYRSGRVIGACLRALAATRYRPMRAMVVDNASGDDTLERIRREHPDVDTIAAPANLGWAAGNAIGVRDALARGVDYVVLLNPDVLVPPGWLDAAVRAMEARPRLALMDFELRSGREGARPDEVMRAPAAEPAVRPVEGASGAALVVRAAALREIGLPDPDYFLYCEDIDWSWRTLAAGWEVGRIDVPLWHASEGSSPAAPDLRLTRSWLSFRNTLRMYLKLRPRRALGWIRSLFIYACSPDPPEEDILNRFRPFGPVRNAMMVMGAVAWNVVHLPETVRVRQRERDWTARGWPL
jgi:N-acetylglucosaminyl-diphospho-decaprenol L-rhamnosyltransferase